MGAKEGTRPEYVGSLSGVGESGDVAAVPCPEMEMDQPASPSSDLLPLLTSLCSIPVCCHIVLSDRREANQSASTLVRVICVKYVEITGLRLQCDQGRPSSARSISLLRERHASAERLLISKKGSRRPPSPCPRAAYSNHVELQHSDASVANGVHLEKWYHGHKVRSTFEMIRERTCSL